MPVPNHDYTPHLVAKYKARIGIPEPSITDKATAPGEATAARWPQSGSGQVMAGGDRGP